MTNSNKPEPDMPNNSQLLYADLSIYYDQFCRDINYLQQCEFAQRAFQLLGGSNGLNYFDLACGTGQHLKLLADAGFTVSGLDNSQAMLNQAALRCPSAELLLRDLAEFDHCNQFDLITCFLYSIHYSHPEIRLKTVLSRAFKALKTGGILVFDMVDKSGTTKSATITTYAEEDGQNFEFTSGWQYSGKGPLMQLSLSIKRQYQNNIQYWQDSHDMSAINIVDIQQYLIELGFEVYIMEHDFSVFTPWQGATFNAIVVAVKR